MHEGQEAWGVCGLAPDLFSVERAELRTQPCGSPRPTPLELHHLEGPGATSGTIF